jgi:ribosome biogenesis GTPase
MKGFVVEKGNRIQIEDDSGVIHNAILKRVHAGGHKGDMHPLALGDYVQFSIEGDFALIHEIYPCETKLVRQSTKNVHRNQVIATNLDQLVLVVSVEKPKTQLGFIDRAVISAISGGLSAIICFNKIDLCKTDFYDEYIKLYDHMGVHSVYCSATTGEGIEDVRKILNSKKSIFVGLSAVGKTSVVNALTGLDLKTQKINRKNNKGKHTTSTNILHKLDCGGYIADVPGIKQLGIMNLENVLSYFPEIKLEAEKCPFRGCTHTKEIDCAVLKAVDDGKIMFERLRSYMKLLNEC